MSLLITLGVIGGIAVLCALYILVIEISVILTAETKLFKTKVQEFIDRRNERKKLKNKNSENAIIEEKPVEIKEINADEIKVDAEEVIEEIK